MTKIIDGKLILNDPTIWPDNLDEVFRLIENGEGNWTFEGECPVDAPMITWAQVKQIAAINHDHEQSRVIITTAELNEIGVHIPKAGTLDISEDDLFSLVAFVVMRGAWQHHEAVTCKPEGDKVALVGETVNDLLNALAEYVK